MENNSIPLVSIIVPLFNCEAHISETIENISNQTYSNIEIIIIDDGSTDNSLAIAKSYESKTLKVFSQKNKGASAARNFGLTKATGTYIQFMDADDLLSPSKIEKQLDLLVKFPDHIAICPTIFFLQGENPIERSADVDQAPFLYSTDKPSDFLLNLYGENGDANMITIHSWLVPINLVKLAGPWSETLSVDDDGEYFCRVVLQSKGIKLVDSVFCYYRKYLNGSNLSSRNDLEGMESIFMALSLKEKHLLKDAPKEKVNKLFAKLYYMLAVECYPRHQSLSRKILQKSKMHLDSIPSLHLGGKAANFLANNISWKLVRVLQHIKRKFV